VICLDKELLTKRRLIQTPQKPSIQDIEEVIVIFPQHQLPLTHAVVEEDSARHGLGRGDVLGNLIQQRVIRFKECFGGYPGVG
jgi:hypothetical protein